MLNHGTTYKTNSSYDSSIQVLIDFINSGIVTPFYNWQGNYTLFLEEQALSKKEAENAIQEQTKNILRGRSSNTENYINNDLYFFHQFAYIDYYIIDYLAYIDYISLVETIIRQQKMRLTCRELRSSWMVCKICKELLTSGVIFVVNK